MALSTKIILFIILSIILTKLPIAGKYFAIINTLIHEVGHQLASMITFGKAHKIKLFANTEGVAYSSHRFWIGRVLTALAGYVFSSFMAAIFFVFIYKGKFDLVLYLLLAILVVCLIFWVRNWYGFFWILTFSAGLFWLLWMAGAGGPIIEYVVLFLVSILFVESITSAFDIMCLSFKRPTQAGDATSLAQLTYLIPAQIWGIVFFSQSLYFGWLAMKQFFPFLII